MPGIDQLSGELRKLRERVENEAAPTAIAEGAEAVRDRAQQLAPVDDESRGAGALRDSIVAEAEGLEAAVGPHSRPLPSGARPEEYGEELEFGDGKQSQPFLRPALDEAAEPAVEKSLKRSLRS